MNILIGFFLGDVVSNSNKLDDDDVLYLKTIRTFGFSEQPWKLTDVPTGSLVKFVKSIKPRSPAHCQCRYHGNGSNKCMHVVIEYNGRQIQTGICMEDAALIYFISAE